MLAVEPGTENGAVSSSCRAVLHSVLARNRVRAALHRAVFRAVKTENVSERSTARHGPSSLGNKY